MALATFKDLCVDAEDVTVLGRFWADVLGRDLEVLDDGDAVVRGRAPNETIWVNGVEEPPTVKHRVHLDLSVGSLEPLLAAGARVAVPAEESGFSWTQLVDPEGGVFCAFVRDHLAADDPAVVYELGVDVTGEGSPWAAARWWAEVLGGQVDGRGDDLAWVEDVASLPFDTIDLCRVPEPKVVKNRVHWDVTCEDVAALVDRGATVLRAPGDDIHWHVLADPWGTEFCAFRPARPDGSSRSSV